MLSRLSQPFLRGLRHPQPALRATLPVPRSRSYAKAGKPPSSQQGPGQHKPSLRSSKPNITPANANPSGSDDIAARASLNSTGPTEQPTEPHQSASPEPPSSTPEPELQQPLPDLTKGIPSTLDAELRQSQSQQKSHKSSVNITEDPAEPLPEDEGEGSRDRTQRQEYVSSSDRKKNSVVRYTYLILGFSGLAYALYMGRNWDTEELEQKHGEVAPNGWGVGLFYNRVRARMGSTMSYYNDPVTAKLLPDEEKDPAMRMPFTLVLSLEDMLIHQEWSRAHGWRIAKRPGVDYFLRYLTQYYELVLFTSQPSATADQVLRKLDPYMMIRWPLFREATVYQDGGYIKDLSYLNRDLKKVVIMDTVPHHVKNQPENAIVLPKWNGDPNDQTLVQMIPFLEYLATMGFDDARSVLKSFEGKHIPAEFARREKLLREKFEAERKGKGKPKKSIGIGSLFKQQSPDGLPTTEDAMAEGKMLWDIIRERGQRNYMELDRNIREEGAKWLAEREAEEKRMQEEAMRNMTRGGFLSGWVGGKKDEGEK